LSHSNPSDFNNNVNTLFKILSEWFKQNSLSLNFTKTQFTNFTTKINNQIEIVLIIIINVFLQLLTQNFSV
jgi:hypothetical protein